MNSTQYLPGDWIGVAAGNHIAFLPPHTSGAVVERLWDSLQGGEDLMSQLMVVTEGRFSGLEPFALASVEGSHLHLLLRGEIEVSVDRAGGSQTFYAPAVSTWLEQIVDGVTHVQFSLPEATSSALDANTGLGGRGSYPILGGVFQTSLVQVAAAGQALKSVETAGLNGTVHAPVPPPPKTGVENDPVDAPPEGLGPDSGSGGERENLPELAVAADPRPRDSEALNTKEQPLVAPSTLDEDHDGMTVMNSEVVSMRRRLPAWEGGAVPGPLVDPADRTAVPKIVLSTGMAVALDRPVLLGRAPQVARVKNDEMPRLITVESPNHDISRTHAEVRMVGSEIMVTDLNSTNGVLLTRPGAIGERLQASTPTPVEAGAIVDLGEGVTFVVGRQT